MGRVVQAGMALVVLASVLLGARAILPRGGQSKTTEPVTVGFTFSERKAGQPVRLGAFGLAVTIRIRIALS